MRIHIDIGSISEPRASKNNPCRTSEPVRHKWTQSEEMLSPTGIGRKGEKIAKGLPHMTTKDRLCTLVRTESIPAPLKKRGVCVGCEFRRFCNDV